MSVALLPAFATAAGLLMVAGVAKLRAPAATRTVLAALGLPASDRLVAALGATEVLLAAVCLVDPSPTAALALAAAYLGFAVVITALVRDGRSLQCGCFGSGSFTATPGHLALNLAAAAIAGLSAAWVPASILSLDGHPLALAVLVAATACAAYLAYLAFTLLPRAWSAYGEGR